MKRIIAVFLIFIIAVLFCACGGKTNDSTLKDASKLTQGSSSQSTSNNDDSPEKTDEDITLSSKESSSSKINSSANAEKPVSQSEQTTNSQKQETQKPTPQQLIHDSWKGNVDMTEFFEAQGMKADRTLYLTFNMTFFPDGSYREFVYTDSYKKLMWDVINYQIAESGMTKDEFEAAYEQQAGMTLSEYIDQYVKSTVNDFVTDYHYKFEGEKLYYKGVAEPETAYKEMGYRFSSDGNTVEFTQEGEKALFYRD